ncbi:hypothetical protein RAS1_03540 [Phycisphaerae bacterium RAS1]|nr:hypothetical protein RAS1_03540 [Phycisphaerae bacterium RAS1]
MRASESSISSEPAHFKIRYVVTLHPEPAGIDHLGRDPIYRLRVALKRLLRSFGLRCVHVRELNGTPGKGADR